MAGIGDTNQPDIRMHPGLPVKPRKRMLFGFHCSSDAQELRRCPLVINNSGDYFRPEGKGNIFLAGKLPAKVHLPSNKMLSISDYLGPRY